MHSTPAYLPALRFRWLTPLYDWLIRWLLPEKAFKEALVIQANLQPSAKILDLGCGTATLTLLAAKHSPYCNLTGVDADPAILRIASSKVAKNGLTKRIQLVQSPAHQSPFPEEYFTKILCSLLFCNLLPAGKKAALAEVFRVLKPRGELHIAEWGEPAAFWIRPGFWLLRATGGFTTTEDLARGEMVQYLTAAGFAATRQEKCFNTLFGTLYLYHARKKE